MNFELKRNNLFYNFLFSIKKFLVVGLLFFCTSVYSQSEYKIYYYSDSVVSSEGYTVDGKPDGYWKTYYQNGVLKSIGKRTDFILDSIWNFYNPKGELEKSITYFEGNKNGYYSEFVTRNDSLILLVKSLYINNIREGNSYYYNSKGYIEKQIPFVQDKMHGQGFEFNSDSIITAVLMYQNNELISRQIVNRVDYDGNKVGTWMEFFPNGNIKTESNYVHGKLNGLYKLFDSHQRLLRVGHYQEDSLVYSSQALEDFEEPFEKIDYYNDSTIKYRGSYKDIVPIGIHRFYNINGTIDSCVLFDSYGTILGKGIMLENGNKHGFWKFYFSNGVIKEQGNYVQDEKSGAWKFYYESGELWQEGNFYKDKPSGTWKWFYKTGELKKEEEYALGKRNGISKEYSISGEKITQGSYIEDKENGIWIIKIGDIIQKGLYTYGSKEKMWQAHYTNGQLQFKGYYFNTNPHKKHVYYYNNGVIEHIEYYKLGTPIKNWEYFDKKGNLLYTVFYKNGREYSIKTASSTNN